MSNTRSFATPAALAVLLATSSIGLAADYETAMVEVTAVGDAAVVGATVVPYKEVVVSAMVPGQIRFLAGHEGDRFKANTLLVQIDDDDLQAKRRAASAAVMAARSAIDQANVQYSRELVSPRINRSMSQPTGFGVPSMFDSFFTRPFSNAMGLSNPWVERYADLQGQVSGLNQANSSYLQARAALDEIDTKIRDARLFTPFDGVITAKMVEVGDNAQPGQPLMRFAYVDFLRLQAEVPVRLVASLRKGQFLPARLDVGSGILVDARVSQIYPIADQARHTVTVKLDLPQGVPGGPGMYAEIRIPDHTTDARSLPTVPRKSLVQRGSLFGVYVLEDGRPSLKMVRVGGDAGEGRVSVLSGLKGGEQVIVNPSSDLGSHNARQTAGD
ncbi:MAG: efflux RND transporter periplasmic adaptor subunit [Hyphomicrobiales bacterium]|nr:MAG: efflux RND transporter periplasmic adaptor subunit [Hyphomicrobiales bacterium]